VVGAVVTLSLVAAAVFPAQTTAVATVVLALSAVGFEANRWWRRPHK
jgi:K+-transporting ATPase c subunit